MTGTFIGHGGVSLFFRAIVPNKPVARVLLVHGYSEHSGRYTHVMAGFAARGFAVLAPDHRGHGQTVTTSHGLHGDLEGREIVLSDLAAARLHLLGMVPGPLPTFVLAHSLGAAFALAHGIRHGSSLAGVVVNGVALRVPDAVPGPVRLLARGLAKVAPHTPLQRLFEPTRNMRDPVAQQALRDDPLVYKGRIRARTGAEVMHLIAEVRAGLGAVRVPLLLTHGAADLHVPERISHEVLAAVGATDKSLVVFPGLLHEAHQEPERDEVVATWAEWMAARLPATLG